MSKNAFRASSEVRKFSGIRFSLNTLALKGLCDVTLTEASSLSLKSVTYLYVKRKKIMIGCSTTLPKQRLHIIVIYY